MIILNNHRRFSPLFFLLLCVFITASIALSQGGPVDAGRGLANSPQPVESQEILVKGKVLEVLGEALCSLLLTMLLIWGLLLPGFLRGYNPVALTIGVALLATKEYNHFDFPVKRSDNVDG